MHEGFHNLIVFQLGVEERIRTAQVIDGTIILVRNTQMTGKWFSHIKSARPTSSSPSLVKCSYHILTHPSAPQAFCDAFCVSFPFVEQFN